MTWTTQRCDYYLTLSGKAILHNSIKSSIIGVSKIKNDEILISITKYRSPNQKIYSNSFP